MNQNDADRYYWRTGQQWCGDSRRRTRNPWSRLETSSVAAWPCLGVVHRDNRDALCFPVNSEKPSAPIVTWKAPLSQRRSPELRREIGKLCGLLTQCSTGPAQPGAHCSNGDSQTTCYGSVFHAVHLPELDDGPIVRT